MKRLLVAILMSAFTSSAYGQTQTMMMPVQTTGISGASAQAQQALNSSAKINMLLGVMLLSSCMSKSPNMMMCMLGAFALAQGMNAQQAANQAAATSAASTSMVVVPAPVTVASPTTVAAPPIVPPAAIAGLKAVSAAGYTVSSNGVTGPNGKAVAMPEISSPAALSNFGIDRDTIQQVQRTIASTYRAPQPRD